MVRPIAIPFVHQLVRETDFGQIEPMDDAIEFAVVTHMERVIQLIRSDFFDLDCPCHLFEKGG